MQEELNRRRTAILADEHGGMIGAVRELGLVGVFATGTAERFHSRFTVGTVDPSTGRTELELRKGRCFLDCIDGRQEYRCIDTVQRRSRRPGCCTDFGHRTSSSGRITATVDANAS